jgi:hypothetical protein
MAAAGIVLWTLGKDWKDKVELHPPYLPNPAGAGKPLAVILGFFPPILTPLAFIAIWILITKHLR